MSRPPGPAPVAQRYGRLRLIKDGNGVQTYLAEGDEPVIVKVTELTSVGAALAMRLTHEADVLGRLTGPDGQPFLVDHGVEDGVAWLAQRYHSGLTLEERLEHGRLDLDQTVRLTRDVLSQLVVVHEHGVIHRDIKPANIVLTGDAYLHDAVLVDFGLARSLRLDPSLRDVAVGTARYCSPEQAGLVEVPIDERSDLYCLGLVLFECLTGRPFLDAGDVGEVLRQQLSPHRPRVGDVAPDVPRAVAELTERLLQIDPARRYQSATAVLADVEEVISARRQGITDPAVVIGRADRRTALADPGFVGRDRELRTLETELDSAVHGHGGVVLLEGESGGGKSRLLDELARLAAARGVRVLRGSGRDRSASRPFQILDGVCAGIAESAEADPAEAERLRRAVGPQSEALAAVAPGLARALDVGAATVAALPEEYGQARAVNALAALLDSVGTEEQPALVVLDDCQWAQNLTARVLTQWAGRRIDSRRTLVVAAFRVDEVSPASALRSVPRRRLVSLSGLTDSEVRDLVTSVAGPVPEDAVATIVRLAGGNAFMAQAVLRGMVESGTLVERDHGWEVDAHHREDVQTSRQAALFLVRRIEALSESAQLLLSATAVIGKEADLDLAVALSGLGPAQAVPAIDELRARRMLWVEDARGRARFTHDMLREAMLERLSPAERAELHLRIAAHLKAGGSAGPYDVAYHLDAGGRPEEALPFALAAAEAARARHSLDDAELYYRIARRGAGDDQTRFRVADGLGEVMGLAGRYAEAEEHLVEAAALAPGGTDQAALVGKLGEVAFRRGDQSRAAAQLETAVRKLGGRVPRHRATLVVDLLWQVLVQIVHTLLPRWPRSGRVPGERERLEMRFYSRLAYVYWFRQGRLRCLWAHLTEMNLAERFGPSPELAQAYSEHGPVMSMIPWYGRGIEYVRRSLSLRRLLGDVWGQGQSLNFYGVVLYAASRYQESVEACEEAVRILALTGDRWEMHTALWNLAFTYHRLGDWSRASILAEDLHHTAERIGDHTAAGIALGAWARTDPGRVPPEAVEAAAGRDEEDHQMGAELSLARALRMLAEDRPADAAAELERAWSEIRRAGLRQEYVAPVLPWLVTATRLKVDSMGPSVERRRLVGRNRRLAHRALRLSRFYRNNLPHALRELALVEARSGQLRRARLHLRRSVRVARVQGAAWEEARSREELGRLGVALGWAGAQADQRAGRAGVQRIEAGVRGGAPDTEPVTLSVAARFNTLLDVGRQIAAATTIDGVLESAETAVAALLRAERCRVVPVEGGRPDLDAVADMADVVSRSAIEEAVASGRVVVRSGAAVPAVADSIVFAGVRSLLCAPIMSDGTVVACLYAVHRQVFGLFGPEEEQLATLIASLAGAALEHVAGSSARFRALIEHAHDITAVFDRDFRLTYVSPSTRRVLGYDPETIATMANASMVHPDDLETLRAGAVRAFADPGQTAAAEVRVLHANGTWRWMQITLTNRTDDPQVAGVVLNLRDTTERRRAEQDFARAAAQFRLAFEHAPIGMALIGHRPGSAGTLLRVNGALSDMLGYAIGDLEGSTLDDLTHAEHRDSDREVRRSFEAGEADTYEVETRLHHRDGNWLWVRLHSALIRDHEGAVDYAIAQVVDVTEQRAAEEMLVHQALHDPLTGLPNRRLFLERLNQALARSSRQETHVAVLYLDLDRFKVINDSYGHATGDLVLAEASRRLQHLTRTTDTLARLGGDEFVVLVEDLEQAGEASAIAQRIEDALSLPMNVAPGVSISVTTSIGITVARPGEGATGLLRDADTALYRAKELGRARHEVFGDHLRQRALSRMRTERELRSAIDGDGLVLHYQPVLDLATGRAVGAEALVRYSRSRRELVPPAEFIDVAEETGLVVAMGMKVLCTAAHQLRVWQDATGNRSLQMAVNVSPRQLVVPGFADFVAATVADAGIDASALALEVTEVALIDSIEASRPALDALRDLGCRIGIDDFGTGYSSLAYLRRLPVDFLKIDQSFVRGLGVNREDDTIVGAVTKLAEALDLSAVAEGVETAEQEAILKRFGCRLAQGYRYGRPAGAEDVLLTAEAPGEGLEPPT